MRLIRVLIAALVCVVAVGIGPASVQKSAAQQASGANPTASAVPEDQLLRELNRLHGRVTIPNPQAATLEQPQGRDYRYFHESILPWIAAIAILGMIVALAAFYFYRGPIRLRTRRQTGRRVRRFNRFERFNHWMTATAFIVLAITGLNYFLGKRLVMPLIGPDAFAAWSQWAKYAHNFMAWPFILGVLIMVVLWLRANLPDRYDLAWLKAGGGFIGNTQPNAGRFNAGQKLIFWSVFFGGLVLAVSGIVMLFPFVFADIGGMHAAQYVHAVTAVGLIAIILGHIYIGTIGMENAFDAMETGQVDLAWACEHHRAWVEDDLHTSCDLPAGGRSAGAPAE